MVEAADHSGRIQILLLDREVRTILGLHAPSSVAEVKSIYTSN